MQRTNEGRIVLAASDVTDRMACAHLFAQRLGIARGERARHRPAGDPYAELIRDRGIEHERTQLARLEAELGTALDLGGSGPARSVAELEAAAARTAEAVASGAPLIFQATFFDGRWQGRADFLRRIEAPSELGGFSYEVIDTKLARYVKPATVHQLMLYSRLLAAIQGLEPAHACVILGDGTEQAIELTRYAALTRRVSARLASAVEEPTPDTYPEPVSHCGVCALWRECSDRVRADDHLSLVARAGTTQRERLLDIGIHTRTELAEADDEIDPARLGDDAFDLLHNQAALQLASERTGEPTHRHLTPERERGYAALPPRDPGDIHFDLEGDPFIGEGGIEYLWGWWSEGGGYTHCWAHDAAAEKAALEKFVDHVLEQRVLHPDMHVFHYAPHERSKLRSLSVAYATREAEVDTLLRLGVLVDLFAITRHAIQVGEESYSLKALERHHGFMRKEHAVREGGGSIVMYEQWLEAGEPAMLESIRAYNEEDCRSTAALHAWLLDEMRPEAKAELGADFAELARPGPEEERPPPEWLAPVEELASRLLSGLPADPAEDSAEQAKRRLLGHLVLYHHREAKPEWWRYFDLRSMSGDDLLWERDAVSEITRKVDVEPIDMDGSWGYTYDFPRQEFKLTPGGSVQDPITGISAKLREIEPGRLVLSRRKSAEPPEPIALVGPAPIGTDVLREAIVEAATAVADGEAAGDAVIKLLDRQPPDLPAELMTADVENLIDAACRLGDGVLPIQGPPGTGKTYRAARMIVGALASGLRVGVTAQSHAAIQNVLREVEVVAREWPYAFDGVYRGGGYESAHGFIESKAGARVEDAHRLVAGTAWLFASPEMRRNVDLLFIDEAGQYSLANAIAAGTAATGIVLLGDPQQLPHVTQADHPFGSGASALEHLLGGDDTIATGRGVLLTESWRMHPEISSWVSERSYEGKIGSKPDCANRRIRSDRGISGAGLRRLEVSHTGRSQCSPEEAEAIGAACRGLLADGIYANHEGKERPLEPSDILVVAPYNMAVTTIADKVPEGVRVGTVDRFQGQEAPVVFYALTCSAGEDVPRGLDFLFDRNRMNVAISRAQALAVLVHSPRLLEASCPTLETMELLNGICTFAEAAEPVAGAEDRGG